MTKPELIDAFHQRHLELINYIIPLTEAQFTFKKNGKWTAGQQLSHVHLTLLPFPGVLSSKEFILERFGKINRPAWSYETVIANYFKTSLQSPEKFLPGEIAPEQKQIIAEEMKRVLLVIGELLEQFTEEELDTLSLPHPLLGILSIREMFYLISYHPSHHLAQTKQCVEGMDGLTM